MLAPDRVPVRSPAFASRAAAGLFACALLLSLGACGKSNDKAGQRTKVPEVGYVVVQPTSVPLVTEFSGRTSPFETSEVRPQVSGVIRKRFFTEGGIVRAGQTLYQIDPSLYQAATNQAAANLQSAQANSEATRIQAERYKPLAQMQAVSQQDYTNAVASARQATAAVAQNKAALETARINLHYTNVPAPISGRIGRSLFTPGALVTASQTDPLAVIQRLDPIYVDIQQASGDLLKLRRALATNGIVAARAVVRLKLEDGTDYGQTGEVEFSEVTVDPNTGTVTLRARFPNPQGILLPGMFVRAEFAQAVDTRAFLVPQPAVSRDPKGNATVFVVSAQNKAELRDITASRTFGANWVVTGGLNPGDKVIVQGTNTAKPGQPVKAVPANTPQRIGVPPGGKGGSGRRGGAAGQGGG